MYNDVAFKTSKLVTKAYSTSFSIAVSFLGSEMRRAIYSIYGFVRFADEIVDTFHSSNQRFLLEKFEHDYYDALEKGISMNPVLHSFALTVKKYNIPAHLVDAFLKSMKADLEKHTYTSVGELNEYIYGSADVVGLMCLMVFVNGNTRQYNQLIKPAMKLGSAFQKVNFLRDLKNDVEQLDRRYFPQIDLTTFDERTKWQLIQNIEEDFQLAKEGLKQLPGKSKLAVFIAFIYYKQLLNNLKRTPASKIISTRIRVADHKKMYLLGKAYVKYQLNLI